MRGEPKLLKATSFLALGRSTPMPTPSKPSNEQLPQDTHQNTPGSHNTPHTSYPPSQITARYGPKPFTTRTTTPHYHTHYTTPSRSSTSTTKTTSPSSSPITKRINTTTLSTTNPHHIYVTSTQPCVIGTKTHRTPYQDSKQILPTSSQPARHANMTDGAAACTCS